MSINPNTKKIIYSESLNKINKNVENLTMNKNFPNKIKGKNIIISEDFKKELEDAENFLEKANKNFKNYKSNIKNENEMINDDKTIKHLENTIKQNKKNSEKISLQDFLEENEKMYFSENNIEKINKNFDDCKHIIKPNKNPIEKDIGNLNYSDQQNNNIIINNLKKDEIKNFPVSDSNEKNNNNLINNKNIKISEFEKENNLLLRYKKQLKSYGFPDIGNIIFQSESDQELIFKFFDYIIIKKSNENGDRLKLKKNCEQSNEKILYFQNENYRLEKEISTLKEISLKHTKENKSNQDKILKLKDNNDKIINELKHENIKLKNRLSILLVEKKSSEEKFSKISENYQKFFSKLNSQNLNLSFSKPSNIEITNTIKKNDILKILSKVNGTEKLIETFKNGYNESLRELLFEISALKNFILEINNEIIEYAYKLDLKNLIVLEENFLNMPFLDSIGKIKYALKTNIKKSFDFWNLEEQENNNNILLTNKKSKSENKIINYDASEKNKSESLNDIRVKNDSLFEMDKSEKNKDSFILKNNQENNNLFDQTNYDHLIDFDEDNFDLELSQNNSKINKKLDEKNNPYYNRNNNVNIVFQTDEDYSGEKNKNSNREKYESNLEKIKNKKELVDNDINKELEYLKEKWMKALVG